MGKEKNEKEDQIMDMSTQNIDLECIESSPINNVSSLEPINSIDVDNPHRISQKTISILKNIQSPYVEIPKPQGSTRNIDVSQNDFPNEENTDQ